jgi:hypothetical protein
MQGSQIGLWQFAVALTREHAALTEKEKIEKSEEEKIDSKKKED